MVRFICEDLSICFALEEGYKINCFEICLDKLIARSTRGSNIEQIRLID